MGRKKYFYPRSPCGERRFELLLQSDVSTISTHALHAESDAIDFIYNIGYKISTHALHAESDFRIKLIRNTIQNFYPRSPCGERQPFFPRLVRQ